MSSTWYENASEWYAPQEQPVEQAAAPEKPKKAKKGWTPLRITGAVLLLLALIVASSLAFGGMGKEAPTVEIPAPAMEIPAPGYEYEEDLPTDPAEFFKNFYQTTQTDSAEIDMEREGRKLEGLSRVYLSPDGKVAYGVKL